MIVLQVGNWLVKKPFKAFSVIDSLFKVMGPEVGTFMRTATLVSAGDMVLHSRDLLHTREAKKTTEELFFTSVISPSFKTKSQLEEAKKQADMETYFYGARVLLDGAFMYYPFLSGHMGVIK